MKSSIIVSILIFLCLSQNLVAKESFFAQRDKQKHILGTGVLATAITGIARNKGYSKMESFLLGAGSALALGALKEGIDGYSAGGTRSRYDVGADAIGAVLGAGISAQFEWKF